MSVIELSMSSGDADAMKASGMGLGESDDPPAQELLSTWPELCRKYDIPCSAMHVSLVKGFSI